MPALLCVPQATLNAMEKVTKRPRLEGKFAPDGPDPKPIDVELNTPELVAKAVQSDDVVKWAAEDDVVLQAKLTAAKSHGKLQMRHTSVEDVTVHQPEP